MVQLGLDTRRTDLARQMDVAFGAMVDLMPHGANRLAAAARLTDEQDQPPWPDRDYFGTTAADRAAQRAMMDATGGPAPMRDPNKPRPRPVPQPPEQAAT